jgi:DNA polymerase-3 subunit delta'
MLDVKLANLLGQSEVSAFLRGIVSRGRYATAYLFHGPAGVGKATAALAFARAALCERTPGAAPPAEAEPSLFGDAVPATAATSASANDACGECRGCRMAATLQHPDLHYLFPVSARDAKGDTQKVDEAIVDVFEELRKNPLHVFQYERAASIRLEQTRELQGQLAFRPHTASRRVVVVRDCDRMREDQYSALLKSIEEPGASTTWVLTTSRMSRVPATIRSRCQRVRFAPLSETLVREVLREKAGVGDEKKARLLAALSTGSLGRALAMRDEPDMGIERASAEALLAPSAAARPANLWASVQKLTGFGKAGREKLRLRIEFQQLWLRDLLRARYGAPKESLVSPERYDALRAQAASLDAREIRRRLMVLEEALRSIEGNVSPDLTLFSAMARAGGVSLGERGWPAHPTGRWDL